VNLLVARDIEKSYGDRLILRGASLHLAPGERVGLVGVNGCGKTTLLSILGGQNEADLGRVERMGTMAMLNQRPELPGETVHEAAWEALSWHVDLQRRYEEALESGNLDAAADAQSRLDTVGWDLGHRVQAVLDRLRCPPGDTRCATLSGGEWCRVGLARVVLVQSDVLLLDEPTNHLDAETVEWLENFLAGYRGAVVLVTHDRYLLEAVANRIVEIEDGECVGYEGSYADYLISRAERRAVLERTEDRRLEMIAREAAWAARSPAARTGKQRARLKRLDALQDQRGLSKDRSFSMAFSSNLKRGQTVLELRGLSKAFGEVPLFDGIDLVLRPGDRVGVVGDNGSGKSTLLKVILGQITPDAGEVLVGKRAKIAVLDQNRTGLNLQDTVYEVAGKGNDFVQIGDGDPTHVASFLERFLFDRSMFDQRVEGLSGGERARLLLARLMLSGANLLMLDEPTNDLDLLTLRVLEEALLGYSGATLVVTHDRAFLDRVCNTILSLEGDGKVVAYASREQMLAGRKKLAVAKTAPALKPKPKPKPKDKPKPTSARLSWREQQELEALPEKIEGLETQRGELEEQLADPETYRKGGEVLRELNQQLEQLTGEVEGLYARWDDLEARA
jgi:ATP-binding cassette subfamily F protein uup